MGASEKRKDYISWDEYFMGIAMLSGMRSKDPNTQVGAVSYTHLPEIIMPDYKPTVNEELLAPLGDLNEENMYVIVTVNVPSDITKIACDLKAPIVVNTDSNKAAQLIVEDDYKVHLSLIHIL